MAALRRTATCGFSVNEAIPLQDAETRLKAGDESILLPMERALPLAGYTPPAFFARLLKNGCAVDMHKLKNCPKELSFVYDGETLVGIGKIQEDQTFKIVTHL